MIIHGESARIAFGASMLEGLAEPDITVYNLCSHEGRQSWVGEIPASQQGYAAVNRGGGIDIAGCDIGCMYGLMDAADALKAGNRIRTGVFEPAVARRGIKLNIPLDSRTPSYSDAGDSAWNSIPDMWDMSFWRGYLDMLARNKYNFVSLWSLNPFPSMVRTPGFEMCALDDVMRLKSPVAGVSTTAVGMMRPELSSELTVVKRISMDEKIAFWRDVMRHGHDRGIDFAVITWNVFTYGTESSGYGITPEMDNPVTKEYVKASVRAMIETYPHIRAIGVTAGENMAGGAADVKWLAETYGAGASEALPHGDDGFSFIHRQHMSGPDEIISAFSSLPVRLELSFKHSQAHMYSSVNPLFGRSFYDNLPEGIKTYLTLRTDDLYMHGYAGVNHIRDYIANMPLDKMAGAMIGSDGYTPARDYISINGENGLVLDRKHYETAAWGRLLYDRTLSDEYFTAYLMASLAVDSKTADALFKAGNEAGNIIPLVNMAHWHDFDFQNYPEGCCGLDTAGCAGGFGRALVFHDVYDFIRTPAQSGSGRLGVREYCGAVKSGSSIAGEAITPVQSAQMIRESCDNTLSLLTELKNLPEKAREFVSDCEGLALLGYFYAEKLLAAVETLNVLMKTKGRNPEKALLHAENARDRFCEYADHASNRFRPQRLSRMQGFTVDLQALKGDCNADFETVKTIVGAYR